MYIVTGMILNMCIWLWFKYVGNWWESSIMDGKTRKHYGWIAGMIPTNHSMKLLNQKGLVFPSSILVSIYITDWSYYSKCTLLSKIKKKALHLFPSYIDIG